MKYTDVRYHKPIADQHNQTVKDSIRSILYSLTYIIIPNIVVKKLTTIATKKLNLFLLRVGFHPIISSMLSFMYHRFNIRIAVRYHLVVMPKSLTNRNIPILKLVIQFIPSICNPCTIN